MKSVIESKVKSGLRRFGIDISYVNNGHHNPEMCVDSLRGAISIKKPFNIIQVGANDGKYNDPIYDFVKDHKDTTNIILVEPMESVIPYLEENYSYHPSSKIVNKAIGDQELSSIRLYGVDQDYWGDINAGYGEDWPDYRIPTGVTTTNKDQLLQWISKNVRSDSNPENIIEGFDVETVRPDSVIDESQNMNDVQLLQVDAEGMDDKIVYSFLESDIHPNIINIESKHLSQTRQEKYDEKMKSEGYDVYSYTSSEKLALK
ncbi:FkbM family methyltransferase [Natronoglomus mannanivorans]|uniref:FkbM family methyltransferase n=1 Tax=Natronoglomus mannanivorans TaxID=2979990 RepID=A0AAP2YVL2_9EURY|nr:FkbM family methyltransferase [Halobacteria archaeon AArc-xg1-1]